MTRPCLVLLFSLAACGGSDAPTDDAGADLRAGDDLSGGDLATPPDLVGTLELRPAAVAVPIGRQQLFQASGATSWTVVEAGGGTITSDGRYTAPTTPGTYHVMAASGGDHGTATITVADYNLTVLAGAAGGPGYMDGVGTAARFGTIGRIVSDGAGHLYVAENQYHTIRKVTVSTGLVETVAGSPDRVGSADGALATASFMKPSALAIDTTNGKLYVADRDAHVVRAIDLVGGTISTLAGTAGASGNTDDTGANARFNQPSGLAYDGAGKLFVAEAGNHRVRSIVVATGAVSTLAGSTAGYADMSGTSAQFNGPNGLVYVGGTLYVADTNNQRIRAILVSSGAVSTLAGSTSGYTDMPGTAAQLNQPLDLVYDGAGALYVADWSNARVRKIVISGAAVSTIAGNSNRAAIDANGTTAAFDYVSSVALDGGALYTIEGFSGDCVVRKVTIPGADVTTVAGQRRGFGSAEGTLGASRLATPTGVTMDAGKLWVVDYYNHVLQALSSDLATLAGSATMSGGTDGALGVNTFSAPNDLVSDGAGGFWIADQGLAAIRHYTADGTLSTPYGQKTMFGHLDGTGNGAKFASPRRLVRIGQKLYVADDNTIRTIDLATGEVTTLVGGDANEAGYADQPGSAARFKIINGLATDGVDTLYLSDFNWVVRKVTISTKVVTPIAGKAGDAGHADAVGNDARFTVLGPVALSGDFLYVSDERWLRRIYLPTNAVDTLLGVPVPVGLRPGSVTTASLARSGPNGLHVDATGNVTLSNESAILRFAP